MQENEEALADLALIREAALKAGDIAMGYFRKNPDVWYKGGRSPVTEADISVNTYLNEKLSAARPGYGWLSEENEDDRAQRRQDRVFVVDPIDGTRAFVNGEDVWCVSIAVVEAGVSLAGVLVCPARREVFEAAEGAGATKNGKQITVSSAESAASCRCRRPFTGICRNPSPARSNGRRTFPRLPTGSLWSPTDGSTRHW